MRRKTDRDSDARNRLFFEPLEPRELLAADSGFDWWSSWDTGAEDEWAWTVDDSWTAETGGDASWDTGFWDGAWWEDDTAWQLPDDGGFDPGGYDWANDLGGDTGELVFDTNADTNADTDTSTILNDPSILDSTVGDVASDEPSATADPPAAESDVDPTADSALSTDAITVVTPDPKPTATPDPVENECTVIEDSVIEDSVIEESVIEESVIEESVTEESVIDDTIDDIVLEDVALEDVALEDVVLEDVVLEDVVLEDVVLEDVAVEATDHPDAAGDDTPPTDDTPAIDDESVVVPIPAAGGPSQTGGAPAASGRGEVFRAWGAFFIPGFGQSTATADGQPASLQAEAGVPVGRPRIRLPFRPAR